MDSQTVFISYSATVFMKMDTFCAEFYYMSLSCIKSGFAQVSFKDHALVCGSMYTLGNLESKPLFCPFIAQCFVLVRCGVTDPLATSR